MRLLITGGDCRLARAADAAFASEHQVLLVDTHFSAPLPSNLETHVGDLRDLAFVNPLLNAIDAVLHLAPIAQSSGDDAHDLDVATRGTYQLYNAAVATGVQRFILGSTLALFDQLPARWRINEAWCPRPTPQIDDLRAWMSELCVRELTRDLGIASICLRFGQVLDESDLAMRPFEPRWLHMTDAIEGIRCALDYQAHGWSIFHITAAGQRAKVRLAEAAKPLFGYQPLHDFHDYWPENVASSETQAAPAMRPSTPTRPIHSVAIFGAGGPLAVAGATELASKYTLRLTDVQPIAEIAERPIPQYPGAPLPRVLELPHECLVVDVCDFDAVLAACAGMDAIVNCSVIRNDPVEAWRVNVLGAYNLLRAAAIHGIRRVVHTGPYQIAPLGFTSYIWDYDIADDSPPRPGSKHGFQLYFHSKYLAQELCRVFADHYGLEIPALLFAQFVDPHQPPDGDLYPFAVSWADAARAIQCALMVETLPAPYEVLHIVANLPHGVFPNRKARQVLGWQPHDSLAEFWSET